VGLILHDFTLEVTVPRNDFKLKVMADFTPERSDEWAQESG
jgi:hypothetical protein